MPKPQPATPETPNPAAGIEVVHDHVIDQPTSADNATPETPQPPAPKSKLAGTTERDTDGLSELDRHRIERGQMKDPRLAKKPAAKADAADTATPTPAPVDKHERSVDDDTGDVLDLRTREARRIRTLLQDRARERARAEAAEERLKALETARREPDRPSRPANDPQAGPTSEARPTDPNDPEPQDGDYRTWNEYHAAHTRWLVREEHRTAQAAERATAQQTREQETIKTEIQRFASAIPAAQERYPDLDAVLEAMPSGPRFRHVTKAILGHEHGVDLAYYLGTTPGVMKAIMEAPTLDAHLRLIGQAEYAVALQMKGAAKPTTPAEGARRPAITRAPLPTTPVATNAGGPARPKDPGEMSNQEYRELRGFGRSINTAR